MSKKQTVLFSRTRDHRRGTSVSAAAARVRARVSRLGMSLNPDRICCDECVARTRPQRGAVAVLRGVRINHLQQRGLSKSILS